MAVKKWPKWIIGISSVLSFTGFLYLTQSHQHTGRPGTNDFTANGEHSAVPQADPSVLVPLSAEMNNSSQTTIPSMKTFMQSRAEFQEIKDLSPEAKEERQNQLEQLDWNSNGTVTVNVPSIQALTPPSDKPAAAITPTVKNSQPVTVTPQQQTKSDRLTRRS